MAPSKAPPNYTFTFRTGDPSPPTLHKRTGLWRVRIPEYKHWNHSKADGTTEFTRYPRKPPSGADVEHVKFATAEIAAEWAYTCRVEVEFCHPEKKGLHLPKPISRLWLKSYLRDEILSFSKSMVLTTALHLKILTTKKSRGAGGSSSTVLQQLWEDRGHMLDKSPKCHPEVAGEGHEYCFGKLKRDFRHQHDRKSESSTLI